MRLGEDDINKMQSALGELLLLSEIRDSSEQMLQ